jgi:hypothetical protein
MRQNPYIGDDEYRGRRMLGGSASYNTRDVRKGNILVGVLEVRLISLKTLLCRSNGKLHCTG